MLFTCFFSMASSVCFLTEPSTTSLGWAYPSWAASSIPSIIKKMPCRLDWSLILWRHFITYYFFFILQLSFFFLRWLYFVSNYHKTIQHRHQLQLLCTLAIVSAFWILPTVYLHFWSFLWRDITKILLTLYRELMNNLGKDIIKVQFGKPMSLGVLFIGVWVRGYL